MTTEASRLALLPFILPHQCLFRGFGSIFRVFIAKIEGFISPLWQDLSQGERIDVPFKHIKKLKKKRKLNLKI
jgi:hypothetical protein